MRRGGQAEEPGPAGQREVDVNDAHHAPEPGPAPDQPIAWMAVREGTPVRSADSRQVGTLAELLASEAEDIFHGIIVWLDENGRQVFVPADDVTLMTPSYLDVAFTADQLASLPEHTEERQAELGWIGRFRRELRLDDRDDSDRS
jgi:hypothetical protein